jgi:addiction module RelE/StbE family toxin
MAHKIIWSPITIEDLEGIADFISRDSESYAASVIQKIVDAVETCSLFPLMGREVPELHDRDIREVIVYKYRVIYRVEAEAIKIGAVIHGSRELEPALRSRPPI